MALDAYSGTWDESLAAHLLRRTLFGATFQQIQYAKQKGLASTLDELLILPISTQPLTISDKEAVATKGQTWVDSVFPLTNPQETQNARNESLAGWGIQNISNEGFSIHEKMTLFWQNHFAAETSNDARATYYYFKLLRDNALGNFKNLVKQMTINPSMLHFLNGDSNTKNSPNENYSRELLELFTVGKGAQVGPGDYTNYTEEDIKEAAKILTGWRLTGMQSSTQTAVIANFDAIRHDTSTKVLSNRLGGKSIVNGNENEYSNYIDVLFETDHAAQFICKKLYRWFVNYDITPTVQTQVIDSMVEIMITNNYEIKPVIRALLSSAHFYAISNRGSIIKNPLELVFSMLNSTGSKLAYSNEINYDFYNQLGGICATMGMNYFRPPNVGGWPAYYQAPNYSRLWINSSYINLRFLLSSALTLTDQFKSKIDKTKYWQIALIPFIQSLSSPSDPVQLIDDLTLLFCPKGLSIEEKMKLKTILTNGLPDFEWTTQYSQYLTNSSDETMKKALMLRIGLTLDTLFKFPEFQTI
jgi:uncharacterized protein (DUF1800 family)